MKNKVKPQRRYRTVIVAFACISFCILATAAASIPAKSSAKPMSVVMTGRDGTWLDVRLASDEKWRLPTPDRISAHLVQALLAYEDQRFYEHPGIDIWSVARALITNIKARRVVSGASTISMQVARMYRPATRTIPNKIRELFVALKLELLYEKDEILRLYFSLAPYGRNVEGVEAAARAYFQKSSSELELHEAALLAVVPNAPGRMRLDTTSAELQHRRDLVLDRMVALGWLDDGSAQDAKAVSVRARKFSLPRGLLHMREDAKTLRGANGFVETTIDPDIQSVTAEHLKEHIADMSTHGVTNGAVVIIDNESHEVLAYVGSADFWNDTAYGQVDGADAKRSPGSTLKPFVYGLALERGLIGSQTMLEDVPTTFSGYTPENYDDDFRGWISASDALTLSLNIPPVAVDAKLQPEGLLQTLRRVGVSTLQDRRRDYGLSIVLGGCEMRLWELAGLYSGLANSGEYIPPRRFRAELIPPAKRLMKPGAAYIVTRMLEGTKRPPTAQAWKSRRHQQRIAWKTGTSYGQRDAWSIGYTPKLTIGVWDGNMSGEGTHALVGRSAAAPLLFGLFDTLADVSKGYDFVQPPDVHRREVCAYSGMSPTSDCPVTKVTEGIVDIEPLGTCTAHQRILIDPETHVELCKSCIGDREYREEVVRVTPPHIARWRGHEGLAIHDERPQHNPECHAVASDDAPVIIHPATNDSFLIRRGVPLTEQRILLRAAASIPNERLHWFVNGKLLRTSAAHDDVFVEPTIGKMEIVVLGETGGSSSVSIRVTSD